MLVESPLRGRERGQQRERERGRCLHDPFTQHCLLIDCQYQGQTLFQGQVALRIPRHSHTHTRASAHTYVSPAPASYFEQVSKVHYARLCV